jgi:norsolorinic acid ketoreductase
LEAAKKPKFVVISSHAGSIGDMESEPLPFSAYGGSKAMVNYVVRKISFENEGLIAFPVHPG